MRLSIDRHSSEPLHRQVYSAVRQAIANGEFPAGSKLPSTRAMAEMLGVSRNTIITAYEELSSDGSIVGKLGSGTRVRGLPATPKTFDLRVILRAAHYPASTLSFCDPDGNVLSIHR